MPDSMQAVMGEEGDRRLLAPSLMRYYVDAYTYLLHLLHRNIVLR